MSWKGILAAAILALAPAAAVKLLGPETVRSHPLSSLLIVAVWAVGTAVFAFVGKVWKELEPRWVKACAEWLDRLAQRFISGFGFRRRYYRQLCYRHRVFNVRGLRTQGTFTLELDKVFVELRIVPGNPQEVSADPLRADVPNAPTENRSIWDFLRSRHNEHRCLAIIGPPGSGKTTLLQQLVLTFARHKQRRCPSYVPVFLFLRNHADAIASDKPPTLADLATTQEAAPAGWFEHQLSRGRCIVFLDGLDEVADSKTRGRVARWVDEQMGYHGANRFLITSRPYGYKASPLSQATVLEVQPFGIGQITQFVTGWYLATEVLSASKDDPGVRQSAAKQAADLQNRVRASPPLAALAVNPLLLTMIAMVHRYRGKLPERRVELYSEICDVFLGHRREAVGITSDLSVAQKRSILESLAFHLMKQRQKEITAQDAAVVVQNPLRRVGITRREAQAAFFKEVESESGLLLEKEMGAYSFAHLTFQEYLAAAYIVENGAEADLQNRVPDTWWHETIRLYAAQADATDVIRACMDAPSRSIEVLTLAYGCLDDARSVEPTVRDELEQYLIAGLDSDGAGRGQLAAEVLLSLRLRNLVPMTEDTEIDPTYLSCAEYQLFLNDESTFNEYHQPDHWKTLRYSIGAGLTPVAGIRYSDAEEFCAWLTDRSRARGELQTRFRLPTPEEAERNPPSGADERFQALRTDKVGTWCRIEGDDSADCFRFLHGAAKGAGQWASLTAGVLDRQRQSAQKAALDFARDNDRRHVITLVSQLSVNRTLAVDVDHALSLASGVALPDAEYPSGIDLTGLASELLRAFDRSLGDIRWSQKGWENPIKQARGKLATSLKLLGEVHQPARQSWWRSLRLKIGHALRRKRAVPQPTDIDLRGRLCESLWTVIAVDGRMKGKLSAWEGLRLVRERVTASVGQTADDTDKQGVNQRIFDVIESWVAKPYSVDEAARKRGISASEVVAKDVMDHALALLPKQYGYDRSGLQRRLVKTLRQHDPYRDMLSTSVWSGAKDKTSRIADEVMKEVWSVVEVRPR
jgi:hypothetical protein